MKSLYDIFVSLLIFVMRVGSLFSYKLKRGLAGRRQSCEIVRQRFSPTDRVIWMHAASLGEYEQGLPVLEKLKKNYPRHKILITFFSPSGYEIVSKRKPIADAVCYLPFDKKWWIDEFTSHFKTDIFFTVKYDYWYNLLFELRNQKAKIFVISALFYETQIFFKPYGKWFSKSLKNNVDWFFHQTKQSSVLAKSIGLSQSSVTGDTRFDRVKMFLQRDNHVPFIEEFKQSDFCIVFGSAWEAEEKMAQMIHKKSPEIKLIIAPHDLKRVENLKDTFPGALLYSQLTFSETMSGNLLIIDSIGILSKLYSYADLAVVGGGFHSAGLHNVLEAAVFGIPVLFGNHYLKNPEADGLIAANAAKSFEDEYFAVKYIEGLIQFPERLQEMGENASQFVLSQPNSSELICRKISSDFGLN